MLHRKTLAARPGPESTIRKATNRPILDRLLAAIDASACVAAPQEFRTGAIRKTDERLLNRAPVQDLAVEQTTAIWFSIFVKRVVLTT
jgi:hypothetical protein